MLPFWLSGAICRVVSLVPEFILTNALNIPLFFRQYGTQGPAFEGEFKPWEVQILYARTIGSTAELFRASVFSELVFAIRMRQVAFS